MARFTKEFENPYPSGWANLPSEDTPITADALQEHTDSADRVESYLEGDLADDLDTLTDTLTYYEQSGYLGRNLCDSKVNPVASATEVWLKSGTYTWSEQSTSGSGAWYIGAKNSSGTVITSSAMTPPSGYNLNSSSAWYYGGADKSSGTFTISQDCCVLIARLDANGTVGLQIEQGTIAHSYTPYSKSNTELQSEIDGLECVDITSQLSSTYLNFKAYKQGKFIVLNIINTIADLPTTLTPLITGFSKGSPYNAQYFYAMTPNGTLMCGFSTSKTFDGRAQGGAISSGTYLQTQFVLVTE